MSSAWINASLLFFLIGCSAQMRSPINRFQSPKAIGTGGGSFSAGSGRSSMAKAEFPTNSVSDALVIEDKGGVTYGLNLGLQERMDLFLSFPKYAPAYIGAKIQVLGGPEAESNAGENSLAVTVAGGTGFDTTESPRKIEYSITAFDMSVIHGIDLGSGITVYEGISFSNYRYSGDVIESSPPLNAASVLYKGKAWGIHVGSYYRTALFKIGLEYGYQSLSWSQTEKSTDSSLGLLGALSW